jgi:hypothetical protein
MRQNKSSRPERRLSLHPLTFDEAVTDVLKIKPEQKPKKKRPLYKRNPKTPTNRRGIIGKEMI